MDTRIKRLDGQRFGKLVVLGLAPRKLDSADSTAARWFVRCDCGVEKILLGKGLRRGQYLSCGCGRRTQEGWSGTGTYRSWRAMWIRCTTPNAQGFENYGGRGIRICDRWKDFAAFLTDMGERPPGKTLDRKDTNGNYEPNNCKWSTPKQQAENRRSSLKSIEAFGQRKTIRDWAKEKNVSYHLLHRRIKAGWHPEVAISEPPLQRSQWSRARPFSRAG